jgi:ribosomal-protein-alanine N-acetyltransferase
MRRRIERLSGTAGGPIALLHQACFPEDPWDAGAIAQVMGIPGFFGHVEWREETPVGFALALDLGREAEILSLGVLREHRRAGVGATLLDAVCSEARERGIRSVVLEVAVNNVAARALYAANSFIVVGHRRNYYRQAGGLVDGLILRRELTSGSGGSRIPLRPIDSSVLLDELDGSS